MNKIIVVALMLVSAQVFAQSGKNTDMRGVSKEYKGREPGYARNGFRVPAQQDMIPASKQCVSDEALGTKYMTIKVSDGVWITFERMVFDGEIEPQ